MLDHVHIPISIPAEVAVSSVVGICERQYHDPHCTAIFKSLSVYISEMKLRRSEVCFIDWGAKALPPKVLRMPIKLSCSLLVDVV